MPQFARAECCSASSGQVPAHRASSSSLNANGFRKALTTTPAARSTAARECPTKPPRSGRSATGTPPTLALVTPCTMASNEEAGVPRGLVGHGVSARIWPTSALCAKK